ncbi:MAG: hypothetical protein LCH91_16420 [Bacteroidetes bacterium]|nr:hypothetical protein [Bacteroidota bacterium]
MAIQTHKITETPDAFIVNGVRVPKMKKGQSNVYDPAIIKAVGSELFFDLVASKQPLPMPDLGFSEAEWKDMEKMLDNDQ